VGNLNSLRIKMVLPVLVIPIALVGLKVIDILLERKKKK